MIKDPLEALVVEDDLAAVIKMERRAKAAETALEAALERERHMYDRLQKMREERDRLLTTKPCDACHGTGRVLVEDARDAS